MLSDIKNKENKTYCRQIKLRKGECAISLTASHRVWVHDLKRPPFICLKKYIKVKYILHYSQTRTGVIGLRIWNEDKFLFVCFVCFNLYFVINLVSNFGLT